jgi:hypothetical protein
MPRLFRRVEHPVSNKPISEDCADGFWAADAVLLGNELVERGQHIRLKADTDESAGLGRTFFGVNTS